MTTARVRKSGSSLSATLAMIALIDSASMRAWAGSYTPHGRSQCAETSVMRNRDSMGLSPRGSGRAVLPNLPQRPPHRPDDHREDVLAGQGPHIERRDPLGGVVAVDPPALWRSRIRPGHPLHR